ncbi:hypothetical protein FNH05_35980 [Amycolatopsis rhizosphaerae]|uniref:PspA-associated domain-containing protein n=1 Tax=Amycolatopsis rhizosphaerae TaxID=2053003 RepID=A0A557ZZW4_9PSEU|nr:hypothetical protein [Amycolatopsis rhizosphaerae]TVT17558.1 hypothetical protein FNH05_35980 [Amycolatopsis rhizosphaerae]
MIARILGEGQLELPAERLDELNKLDDAVVAAMEAGEESAFIIALDSLVEAARRYGTPVPDDSLVPSDLVLPAADSSLAQVRALLGDEGLIPG